MGKLIEMDGRIFDRLTVVRRVSNGLDGKPQYLCKCLCGSITTVRGKLLRSGRTRSCGCLRYERLKESITKHGYAFTKTYKVWCGMHSRCVNPTYHAYKDYGGRGIKVCQRWMNFENFLSDMGHKPFGKTIDRIDVNRDYEPSNCRWATASEQANNKRNTILLSYLGITQSISAWARQLSIPRSTLMMRYKRRLTEKDILSSPKKEPKIFQYGGKMLTLPTIAKLAGISYVTLAWRIRNGIPIELAVIKRPRNHVSTPNA